MKNDFAIRLLQYFPQTFVELQPFGGLIESGSLLLPGILFLLQHQRSFHTISKKIALASARVIGGRGLGADITNTAGKPSEYIQRDAGGARQ